MACSSSYLLLTFGEIEGGTITSYAYVLPGRGILKIIMQKLDGLIIIQAITQMHMTTEVRCQSIL